MIESAVTWIDKEDRYPYDNNWIITTPLAECPVVYNIFYYHHGHEVGLYKYWSYLLELNELLKVDDKKAYVLTNVVGGACKEEGLANR